MTKLTDSQLVILGKACERPDRAIYPLTTRLSGGAVTKVLTSLITRGLIKEARARRDETIWRRDAEDRPLTLYATPAACQALGIEQNEAPEEAEVPPAESKAKRTRAAKPGKAKKDNPARTRDGTKQALLMDLLKRPNGATIADIVEVTGWQPHTVRGAIAGALKKRLGLTVTSEKVEGRGRVYRI